MSLIPPTFIDQIDPGFALKPHRRYLTYLDINISKEKLKNLNICTLISGNVDNINEEITFIDGGINWSDYYSVYYGSTLIYFSINSPEMEGDTIKLRYDDETGLPTPNNDALYYDENYYCYYDSGYQYPIKRTGNFGMNLIYSHLYGTNPPTLSLNIYGYCNNPDQAYTGSLETANHKKIEFNKQCRTFVALDSLDNKYRIIESGEIVEVVPTIPGYTYVIFASEHTLHKIVYGAGGEFWKYEDIISYHWWLLKERLIYVAVGSGSHGNTIDTGSNLKVKLLCGAQNLFDAKEIRGYRK